MTNERTTDDTTVAARIVLAGKVREVFENRLRHRVFDDVENMYYDGMITSDDFAYYVHRWQTGAFRYSTVGGVVCPWCGEKHNAEDDNGRNTIKTQPGGKRAYLRQGREG